MKNSQQHTNRILPILLILAGILAVTVPAFADERNLGLRTVCIDAGHGGKDPGCISKDGTKTKEKDITLSIATYLSNQIKSAYPDVKVVLTRSDDKFIELGERANIANRNNADLFISIHVNAVDSRNNRGWAAVKGFSIHTLGQSRTGKDLFSFNMEVCKRENSVILLEDDYTTKYQGFDPSEPESFIFFNLMQNANLGHSLAFAEDIDRQMRKGPVTNSRGLSQDPFYVLWKTTMPAVLIEVGFITNASDLAIMKTEEGRKGIANRIYRSFVVFKNRYDASMNISSPEPVANNSCNAVSDNPVNAGGTTAKGDNKHVSPVAAADSSKILYGTQILASARKMSEDDKSFKGYKPVIISSGNLYKYIIGVSVDIDGARTKNIEIKKLFPQSFLVSVQNGETARVK